VLGSRTVPAILPADALGTQPFKSFENEPANDRAETGSHIR
jgi:hypothetical protein